MQQCNTRSGNRQSRILDTILADLNDDKGPLAWQLHARQNGGEVRVLDRAAFATERAISKALQRLEAPNNQDHLALRAMALQLLVQVSDIDLVAFWERVARAGGAVLKTAQKDGTDVAAAYEAVQDAFEIVIATAARVAEGSGAQNKIQGEGYQRFCEYWLSFARKAGSASGVERATAAMSGTVMDLQADLAKLSISSPTSSAEATPEPTTPEPAVDIATRTPDLSDKDIAKICAILTGSVLALDKVLAGTSDSDAQAKIDDAANILRRQVGRWPKTASMASQLKFNRVLDQLHRRCCSKLSSQGSDSKGQPKVDTSGSANVDELSRACLHLLRSLLKHVEPSSTSTPNSNPATASTPSKTVSLPSKDTCLTDIVYGYRVLANKLFSVSSQSARDVALSEMQKCKGLLQSELVQASTSKVISEQLRLLSSSFYNPAGILYNATNYVEASVFLQLAVDCDHESIEMLKSVSREQQEPDTTLATRHEAFNKKLEYTAVAYRFAGDKARALRTYGRVLLSITPTTQQQVEQRANSSSIDDCFKATELKTLGTWIKAIVDLSVHDLNLDMDSQDQEHSLTNWLLQCTNLAPSVKGAILEQAFLVLESRSHLSGTTTAMNNIHFALLQIYDASVFPLRHARTLARKLETDVLSHALALPEEEVVQLEIDALACLDRQDYGKDESIRRFQAQYRCSVLISAALHTRLRKPFESPEDVAIKVELACKGLSSVVSAASKAGQPTTPHAVRASPKTTAATPSVTPLTRGAPRKQAPASTKAAATRRPLSQRSAPPQATATPTADPKTPPSKTGKPTFDTAVSAIVRPSPRPAPSSAFHSLDRAEHFCQTLLTFHEAFSALSLTQCSVQILKALRQALRPAGEVMPGLEEIFCRASADLAQAYLGLGKPGRADTVLRSASAVLSRHASPNSPTSKLVLVSQDVRFRCLMVQAQLLCQERDLGGAQARFSEGLKLAQTPSRGEKPSTSSMERLRQRERQAIAFSVCAQLQMARGDLAPSIESTTLALRQLIRLSSNLSHIASRSQASEQDKASNQDSAPPSSDPVMTDAPQEQQKQEQQKQEQQLPKFAGTTFSSLFWRTCGMLLNSYMMLSRLHSVRGSALDAEAMAGEGIDFATSMRFSLPLARALIDRGELRLQLNRPEQGQEDLSRCLEVLQDTWIPEVVSLSYVQGDCLMRIQQLGGALQSYTAGEATLRALSTAFADAEHANPFTQGRGSSSKKV